VTRTLTLTDLAGETGVDLPLLRRLAEIGVIRHGDDGTYTPGDVIRVEAVRSFVDAGVTVDKIAEALEHGLFTFEYLDRFHPEPSPHSPRTLGELAASLNLDNALLSTIYLAMGLPEPGPNYRPSIEEEQLLQRFTELWGRGGEDALVRAARLIGEPARFLSEGWTRLYVEKIAPNHTVGPMDERIGTIVQTTQEATLLAPLMFQWLLQTHLRRSIDRANIEGLEGSMKEHGLSLPLPETLPAIAFIDISGYTTMTVRQGDTEAVRASEVIRERAQRVARAHQGSLVKLLGDGAMVYFQDARLAVAAICDLVGILGEEGLPAHAGIHAGSMMEHDGDYYGSTVNLASRIADQAGSGEVLVSGQVVGTTRNGDFDFESLNPVQLKGIDRPLELYRVVAKPAGHHPRRDGPIQEGQTPE
jgi:adenylate cyclase